jgi:conjugal transfer pilus assembly protein TraU
MKWLHILLSVFLIANPCSEAACVGRFVNPLTDICWSCLFPMTLGADIGNITSVTETPGSVCWCPRPPFLLSPVPGIPVSFWEPVRLIEITRTPYCLLTLGGTQLATGKAQGAVEQTPSGTQHSFYQVHWYVYPVIYWLELLTDFSCLEKGSLDVGYLTELDPLWNDDALAFILNPEAILFANTTTQAACAADCVAASVGFPIPALFWCGGCQGSLYPFTGTVGSHSGGLQASLLLAQRFMAKLHRQGLLWGYIGTRGLCGKYPMPIIQKQQYQTQMVYPQPTQACHPLGRSDVFWGIGKEYPYQGEDFGYLIWRKRLCCLL